MDFPWIKLIDWENSQSWHHAADMVEQLGDSIRNADITSKTGDVRDGVLIRFTADNFYSVAKTMRETADRIEPRLRNYGHNEGHRK